MGGLRGASAASNGALFEAVKNNVSFDVDENSVNDLKARQETIKDYREVERAENELNAEVNRIRDSIVNAGMPMSQANAEAELLRAAAIGANPDNPAQWLKDNLNEFVRRETIEDDAYNQAFRMSKKAKAEYAAKMREVDDFVKANNIRQAQNGKSFYFELNGQKYRVSNHTVEASNAGAFNAEGQQVRDLYHPDGRGEEVQIFASPTRVIEIYNAIKDGKQVDGKRRVIIGDWYNQEETKIKKSNQAWNKHIDDYVNKNENGEWAKTENGKVFEFSEMPAVLKAIGATNGTLNFFGSFFDHALNTKHIGMNTDVLRELPNSIFHPIMIFKGNLTKDDIKNGIGNNPKTSNHSKIVLLVETKNETGVNVIVPIELNKQHNKGYFDILKTAYSKISDDNKKIIDIDWLEQNIKNNILYADTEKSILFIKPLLGSIPSGDTLLKNALSNISIVTEKDIVKQNNNAYNQQDLGATSWDEAGRATIALFPKADASTLIHESGHYFFQAILF